MSISGNLDTIMEDYVLDESVSPSRTVIYTKKSDGIPLSLQAFVGNGKYNKEEKETLENFETFGGLKLSTIPIDGDTIAFNGVTFKTRRYSIEGNLYTVIGETSRHRGRASK